MSEEENEDLVNAATDLCRDAGLSREQVAALMILVGAICHGREQSMSVGFQRPSGFEIKHVDITREAFGIKRREAK